MSDTKLSLFIQCGSFFFRSMMWCHITVQLCLQHWWFLPILWYQLFTFLSHNVGYFSTLWYHRLSTSLVQCWLLLPIPQHCCFSLSPVLVTSLHSVMSSAVHPSDVTSCSPEWCQAVHQSDVTRCLPEWCHQVFTRVMSPGVHPSEVTRCSPEWCHQVFIPVPRAGFITASADVTCSGTSWRRKVVYLGCFSTKPSTLHVSIARLDPCCHPFICSPQPSTLPPSLCPVSITCFHIFDLSPFPSPAVGLSNSPPSNFVELLPVFY